MSLCMSPSSYIEGQGQLPHNNRAQAVQLSNEANLTTSTTHDNVNFLGIVIMVVFVPLVLQVVLVNPILNQKQENSGREMN